MVRDSSSFLHVEKMDSDVANSKYQSLFFILCGQHKASGEETSYTVLTATRKGNGFPAPRATVVALLRGFLEVFMLISNQSMSNLVTNPILFFCLVVFVVVAVLETGLLCVALTTLEFQYRLGWSQSQGSDCLCLLSQYWD